jgi:membrane protein DedA with SNARE-associated domain
MTSLVQDASQFIADHRALGAALIGLVAFGESMVVVGAFVPATVLLVAAGGLIAAGLLDATPVIVWATIGAVAGDAVSFMIGRRLGPRVLRHRLLKTHLRALARTRLMIRRSGGLTLFVGRFAGPLRALIPVMAGMMGMPERRFQLANLASGLVWVGAFVGPGYAGARGLTFATHQSPAMLATLIASATAVAAVAIFFKPIAKWAATGLVAFRASAVALAGGPMPAALGR